MISEADKVRWFYNCKDIIYTWEIASILEDQISKESTKLQEFHSFQQSELAPALVDIMNSGIRIDLRKKEELHEQLSKLSAEVEEKINYLLDEPFNTRSVAQVKMVFQDLLKVKAKLNKKSGNATFGTEAMWSYLEEYPVYRTLIKLILELRSINVFLRTFLSAKVDDDGRMRTNYNVAGTSTYRLASRKNAFGAGMNLQNVPSKGKIDLKYAFMAVEGSDDDSELYIEGAEAQSEGITELPNCKTLFIPDSGYTFFDIDYSGADARVVAWDSDCKFLMEIFNDDSLDLYSVLASEYFKRKITKKDKERQTFKAVCHACLTGEHEVLTKEGWVRMDEYKETNALAVWDKDSWDIKFEVPLTYNRDFVDTKEQLFSIEGAAWSTLSTLDHAFPVTTDKKDNLKRTEADRIPKSGRIPYTGKYIGGSNKVISPDMAKLIAAVQADGHVKHISNEGLATIEFRFVKERKILRLKWILDILKIPYTCENRDKSSAGNEVTSIAIKHGYLHLFKYADWGMLEWNRESLTSWLYELPHWDGSIRTSNGVRTSVTTTQKEYAEIIQTIAHLSGLGSKLVEKTAKGNRKPCYEVSLNKREFHNMATGITNRVDHKGTWVFCPQTTTGYFLVRRNGNIMVSGNTNYLGKAPTIAGRAGLLVAEVDMVQKWYFSACPEVKKWQDRIIKETNSRGYIENVFGARGWFLDRTDKNLYNKAVAWVPQSTIGILVNKGLVNVARKEKKEDVRVLMQTHDSLSGQFRTSDKEAADRIVKHMSIELKYSKPLVIPAGIKTSTISYGDCD